MIVVRSCLASNPPPARRPAGRPLAGLVTAIAVVLLAAPPGNAQLRWQSFLHGGQTHCVAALGSEVWVGTSAGLRVVRTAGDRIQVRELGLLDNLPGHDVTAVGFQPDVLWIGTREGRIGRLDFANNQWMAFDEASGLTGEPVTALCYDGEDVWAGLLGGGVARFNVLRQDWELRGRSEGLGSGRVRALAGGGSILWAGTDDGLWAWSREEYAWQRVDAPTAGINGAISGLALSPTKLWVAAADGSLASVDRSNGEVRGYSLGSSYGVRRLDAIGLGDDGTLWLATDAGLLEAAHEGATTWRFHRHGYGQVSALALTADSVWLATVGHGVIRFRPEVGDWQNLPRPSSLPGGEPSQLVPQANLVWAVFADAGLASYDTFTERWSVVGAPETAPRRLRAVAAWGREVYCAGSDGLGAYDQRDGRWKVLRQADDRALLGDEWTALQVAGERVWAAGPGRVAQLTADLRLLRTFQIGDPTPDPQAELPRLVLDEANGDLWLLDRGVPRWFHSRSGRWMEPFPTAVFEPRELALARLAGRLVQDLACDNDSVWSVTMDRVVEYRKQLNELWVWDETSDPGLAAPARLATDRFSVWVAGTTALARFERSSRQWRSYPLPAELRGGAPTALAVDQIENCLWLSTPTRLARLQLGSAEPIWQPVATQTGVVTGITQIMVTPEGVWFVGRGGLTLYRRPSGSRLGAAATGRFGLLPVVLR